MKNIDEESFFNVFKSRINLHDNNGLDSDEENENEYQIELAYNLAIDIRDMLIPSALEFYLCLNDDLDESKEEMVLIDDKRDYSDL